MPIDLMLAKVKLLPQIIKKPSTKHGKLKIQLELCFFIHSLIKYYNYSIVDFYLDLFRFNTILRPNQEIKRYQSYGILFFS